MDAWIKSEDLKLLGVSEVTIWRKVKSGKWIARKGASEGQRGKPQNLILLSSLPHDLQLKWARLQQATRPAVAPDEQPVESDSGSDVENDPHQQLNTSVGFCSPDSSFDRLHHLLQRYPLDARDALLAYALHCQSVVERFEVIDLKSVKDPQTGATVFVPEVLALCQEAICTDPLVIAHESRRAVPPSPFTLRRWAQGYKKEGLLAFIRALPTAQPGHPDRRKVDLEEEALQWINDNWRNSRSATAFRKAYRHKARTKKWYIPSPSWFQRLWTDQPEVVMSKHLYGEKAYVSRYAPYVPRDYSDLEALQVLCGDHSQRDVTVMLRDGSLARPWLTLWYDPRTGLIWGWHLDLVPSAYTVGAAYADGVMNFGAQPPARPDEGFYSYVYTDRGRDYRSKNWDGKTIAVHKAAMDLTGGIEALRVQRRVGIIDDLGILHLLARGYNAREKIVERVHRDISDWEENTFPSYCGRDAKSRPDQWRELYAKHEKLARRKRVEESPIIRFDEYRQELGIFIHEYNSTEHERSTLGGARIVPLDEHRRLYTTRYEIAEEALALLLMKAEVRKIGKNGVQCFQREWRYLHEAMALFKGQDVEIRYSDADYSRVWAVLPDGKICEASLVNPTSLINPNKQTLQDIAKQKAYEKRLQREHQFLTFSKLRGETVMDRVAQQQAEAQVEELPMAVNEEPARRVRSITRMDKTKLRAVGPAKITAEQLKQTKPAELVINEEEERSPIRQEWEVDE